MVSRARSRGATKKMSLVAAVVAVITVMVLGSGVLGSSSQATNKIHLGSPIAQSLYSMMKESSGAPYGPSGSPLMSTFSAVDGQPLYSDGNPVVLSVTGEFCSHCALQRWPLKLALMRFGDFTGLEYMASSPNEGNYSTFSLAASTYRSDYLRFESYEVYDRAGIPLQRLPANYSEANQQDGGSVIPFLDLAGKYVLSGSLLPDASILGTKTWTQVVLSIEGGDSLGLQIKEAANAITSAICMVTDGRPWSVCDQPSIVSGTGSIGQPSTAPAALQVSPVIGSVLDGPSRCSRPGLGPC